MKKLLLAALLLPILMQAQPAQKSGSGNAISLNGTNQNVDIGTFFNYQVFTIELWVKPGATQVQYADILDNNHSTTRSFVLQQNVSNTNQYYFGGSTGAFGILLFNLSANVWQHIAIVSTKTQKFVYVNGTLTSTFNSTDTIHYDGTQFLRLGRHATGVRYWNGSMDEVRMWNVALTQTQIRDRMCHKIKTSDLLYSHLLLYYNFDESSGTTVFDGSGNNHNGNLINNPARILSGAPIGNASAYTYGGNSVKLESRNGENLKVDKIKGDPASIHLYRVDDKPSIKKGIKGLGPNKTYFGVFPFKNSSIKYRVTYNYTGNPYVIEANEDALQLYTRTSNADSKWMNSSSVLDTAENTLITDGDSSAEYILGSTGEPLQVPKSVSINDTTVNEGNAGNKTIKIPVILNEPAVFNSSVNYSTEDSTATAGQDYVSKSGIVNFAVGQLTDTIKIVIKGDTKVEQDEAFKIVLSNPVNISIADTVALITIKDNDAANFAVSATEENNNTLIGKSSFSISPNPTKDFINITSPNNINDAQISITDMYGKTLYNAKQSFIAHQQLKINLSQFSKQVLIVSIESNNRKEQLKIVKE